jgi:hypothetical protein
LDKSGCGGELLMIFKIFRTSSDFILISNILMGVMRKELQLILLIGAIWQNILVVKKLGCPEIICRKHPIYFTQ